jgi:hypothetical protein
MTYTDPSRPTTNGANDPVVMDTQRGPASIRSAVRETKPSPRTTELWVMIGAIVALTVVYNASADLSLNLFRACLLGTIVAAAYIMSRGFAKAESRDDDQQLDGYGHRA